jgi:hypothetical protein
MNYQKKEGRKAGRKEERKKGRKETKNDNWCGSARIK